MKRLLAALLLVLGLTLFPGRGEAQVWIQFGNPSDTAAGALTTGTTTLLVSAYNPVYSSFACSPYGYCLSYARLTFVYDPTLIDSMAVEAVADGFTTLSTTSATGAFTVTASSLIIGSQLNLFRLRYKLAAGAHDGGYLWARVDSVAAPAGNDLSAAQGGARASAIQVCHATNAWGDVDENGRVDSRDALITLSAAVGLSVSGFSLGFGDVDDDGLTNSRDALMMLSSSIGIPISQSNRVGIAIPDACPGLSAPGETVVFQRSLAVGGGIFRLDPLSMVPVQVTTDAGDGWPRLNAAGTKVAFQCWDPSYPQVCVVDLAGSNRRMLTGPGAPLRTVPDWSPDGTKLAFLAQSGGPPILFTMDSSGANQLQVGAVPLGSSTVAWSRDGGRLAYLDWNASDVVRTVTTNVAHTVVTLGAYGAGMVRWSPDNALIAFQGAGSGPIWGVPASGGTPRALATIAGIDSFDWGSAGIVFSMTAAGAYSPSLWLLRGGPAGTLVRLTASAVTDADRQPAFRRNP